MNAIYTSFHGKNKNGFSNFNCKEDWMDSLFLSSTLSKRKNRFDKVNLWCDPFTNDCIKEDGRDWAFDEIIVVQDTFDWLFTINWAYVKIWVYAQQEEPFIHIDNDAFFNEAGNIDKLFQYRFCFQSYENFGKYKMFDFYKLMYNEAKQKDLLSSISTNDTIVKAINTAIFAVTNIADLAIVRQYHDAVKEYILKQQQIVSTIVNTSFQSCLFEQLFIAIILENLGLKEGIDYNVLLENDEKVGDKNNEYGYTHFIFVEKQKPENIAKIQRKLFVMGLPFKGENYLTKVFS